MLQIFTAAQSLILSLMSVMITILSIRLLADFVISLANLRIDRKNFIYSFLVNITEPFCKPFSRLLPDNGNSGMSCLFAIITFYTLTRLVGRIFIELEKLI